MSKLRGFTLIELLIVVAIIAILAAIAVPNFLEAQTRSKVSRVRSDQRSLATAIETYYVDNNEYPAFADDSNFAQMVDRGNYAGGTKPSYTDGVGVTFKGRIASVTEDLSTLSTPIAYITSYFADPFADTRGATFRYYSDRRGWILGSYGPDVDEAIGGNLRWGQADEAVALVNDSVETFYDTSFAQPSELLLTGETSSGSATYDPTNGTVSDGDVWRVKQ